MPAPATANLGRLQTQGNGEATAGPNGMGAERTYCTRVRAMPAAVLAGDRLSRRP